MTTTGIEIRRDTDLALLLTYNLQNPLLVDKGNVTSVASPLPDHGGSYLTVPNTGSIRALKAPAGVYFHKTDTTHWWCSGAVGTVCTYYHFGQIAPTALVSGQAGIEIYADSAGLPLQFSSGPGNKALRADNVMVSVVDALPSLGSAKTIAIAHGAVAWYLQDDNPAYHAGILDDNYWVQRKYVYAPALSAANVLSFNAHCVDAPTSDPGWVSHLGGPYATVYHNQIYLLFLDVTGY